MAIYIWSTVSLWVVLSSKLSSRRHWRRFATLPEFQSLQNNGLHFLTRNLFLNLVLKCSDLPCLSCKWWFVMISNPYCGVIGVAVEAIFRLISANFFRPNSWVLVFNHFNPAWGGLHFIQFLLISDEGCFRLRWEGLNAKSFFDAYFRYSDT